MIKNITTGLLISVEGVDGSGKTSFCSLLSCKLSENHPVLLTKEPGGTRLGMSLRNLLLHAPEPWDSKAEFLLFAADRAQHFTQVVMPALKNNTIVISDRMADSSLVYQGYVKNLPLDLLQTVNTWAMQNRLPDVTFFLEIDEATMSQRIAQRNMPADVFEKNKSEIIIRMQSFKDLFKNRKNVCILDARKPLDVLLCEALEYLHIFLGQ